MDGNVSPIIPEKIKMAEIIVTHSSIDCNPDTTISKEVHGYEMKIGHEIAYNFDGKRCRVRLRLEFIGVNEDHGQLDITGNFTLEYHFEVENMPDCIRRTKDGITIKKILPATLLGMAYSTARGIILERTSNTLFLGIILPVIDPNLILDTEDFKITKDRA